MKKSSDSPKNEKVKETKDVSKKEDVVMNENSKEKKENVKVDVKKLNIFEKMSLITNELGVITKELTVEGNGKDYKAISERSVIDSIKPLENKYGIFSYPESRTYETIEELGTEVTMRCTTVYKFVNVHDPSETLSTVSYGDGVDTLDKAPGKAMTYADKYALMKMYKISTGDDLDSKPSPEEIPTASKKITEAQIKELTSILPEERYKNMLKSYKLKKIEDMSYLDAQEILKKLKK